MRRDLTLAAGVLSCIAALDFNTEITLSEMMQALAGEGLQPKGGRSAVLELLHGLITAGFVEGRVTTDGFLLKDATVWRLTWAGQDLLDRLPT